MKKEKNTIKLKKKVKENERNRKQNKELKYCKVDADKLKSKSKNTAIEGKNLQGKILMTYLNGELVYSN